MIEYSDYKKIQKMKEQGYNAYQVVKRLNMTEYSVYRWWNVSEEEFLGAKAVGHAVFDKYKDFIIEELRAHPYIRSSTILDHIKEEFGEKVESSMASFYRYMKRLRKQEGFLQTREVRQYRVQSPTKPGEQAQVDMGQMKLKDINGDTVKVFFFCMVLSYSRMKFVWFSAVPFNSNRFVYAHDKAFRYFGGRPQTIMYDQDRVMVVSENAGDVVFTREFERYRNKVGYTVYLCKKEDPDTKGKVENVVKYVKTSFLDSREYAGLDSLNAACLKWLDRTGNGVPSAATYKIPREMFEEEAKYLIPYQPQQIPLVKQRIVTVSDVNTVLYKKNRYAIPVGKYPKGTRLKLEENGDRIIITDPTNGELVAEHKRIIGSGGVSAEQRVQVIQPTFAKLQKRFADIDYVTEFLSGIVRDRPRYLLEQAQLLNKTLQKYKREEVLKAIKTCGTGERFDATEVVAQLIKMQGIKKAKEVIPKRTAEHYKKKADRLSQFDILLNSGGEEDG